MRDTPRRLRERYEKSLVQKRLFRDLYERAYRLGLPQRNLFDETYDGTTSPSSSVTPGRRKDYEVYDSTGIIAVNSFVNHMQASLTPPFKKWVELKAGPAIPKNIAKAVNEGLEIITEVGFEVINSSNFNVAVSEFYYDLSVGTAAMMVIPGEDDEVPIRFIPVPIEQISLEDGVDGTVGAIFRKFDIAAKLIKEKWKHAKIPSTLARKIEQNPECDVSIIESTYKSKKQYYYDVIVCEGDERIVEDIFPFNPWIVTRLGKTAVESYGRGPLIQCLADLQMLNKAKELSIRSAQYNVFGLYTVADNDIMNPNTLRLTPGAFITVARNGGPNGPSIAPLPRAGDVNLQQLMTSELQANIKTILLNDRLPPEIGPVRSATEIAARERSGRIDTDSYFGRLMYEFVQPLWQNVITILDMKGLIDLPPELSKIDNYRLKINVLSPIAKEQGYQDLQSLVQAVEVVRGIGGQELVMLTFKLEDVGQYVGDKLGISSSLMRGEDERMQMQQMIAESQMAAAAMQQEGATIQ